MYQGNVGVTLPFVLPLHRMGVLHRHANLGPYNTDLILTFFDRLHNVITAANQRDQMQYVVVWDNVAFRRSALVQNWFHQHPQFTVQYLPPYSPFLNPIEEFFSAWRWKVYDLRALCPDGPHSSYGGSM
ncbi:hypothetical protein J4Q44_G00340970 [Coregonus suidteri]|uniref:Tc1-like transposase DDE domain-containing protein n=1 Tax=Coregonus suidteri TaxID=861788 RepID=A0AAN8KTQ8_9TELE